MVLVLNGVLQEESPVDTRTLYLQHPVYRDTAAQLLSIPTKVMGPVGLLYVQQREFAATVPHDKNVSILGSDDATTCIIVVVRHSGAIDAFNVDDVDVTGTATEQEHQTRLTPLNTAYGVYVKRICRARL